jgi:hypothetical protein
MVARKPDSPPLATVETSQIFTNLQGLLVYANKTIPVINDTEYYPHEEVFLPSKFQKLWNSSI